MSSFFSDEKIIKGFKFCIYNIDDYFGQHKYGYRPIMGKKEFSIGEIIGKPNWQGSTHLYPQDAEKELNQKIKEFKDEIN